LLRTRPVITAATLFAIKKIRFKKKANL